jgi:hypothetical protein
MHCSYSVVGFIYPLNYIENISNYTGHPSLLLKEWDFVTFATSMSPGPWSGNTFKKKHNYKRSLNQPPFNVDLFKV